MTAGRAGARQLHVVEDASPRRRGTVRRGLDADLAGLDHHGRAALVALARRLADGCDTAAREGDVYKLVAAGAQLRQVHVELAGIGPDGFDELLAALRDDGP